MTKLPFDTIKAALFPMPGTYGDKYAQEVFDHIIPRLGMKHWADLAFIDTTAGALMLPSALGMLGAREVIVNDLASRTRVAALGLYHGASASGIDLEQALYMAPDIEGPSSAELAPGFYSERFYSVFDKLWFNAHKNAAKSAYLRYMALLWITHAKASDGFYYRRTDLKGKVNYARADAMEADPKAFFYKVAKQVDVVLKMLQTGTKYVVHQDDMTRIAEEAVSTAPIKLYAVNPPTDAADSFYLANIVCDCLLDRQPVPQNYLFPKGYDFDGDKWWASKVRETLAVIPSGAFVIVGGGDAALSFDQCKEVWDEFGEMRHAMPGKARALRLALYQRH